MENNRTKIEMIRVILNIIMIVLFLVIIFLYISYSQSLNEAISSDKPTRLITLYENKTGENCECINLDYGYVIKGYYPIYN